jgi:hypothetical protein
MRPRTRTSRCAEASSIPEFGSDMKATSMGERSRAACGVPTERLNQHVRLLADRLPDMIDNATTTYQRLATREMADDVKSVAAHQVALRSTLAHLEALLNLARRLEEPDIGGPPQNDHDMLEHLYSQAAAAVALLPEEPED